VGRGLVRCAITIAFVALATSSAGQCAHDVFQRIGKLIDLSPNAATISPIDGGINTASMAFRIIQHRTVVEPGRLKDGTIDWEQLVIITYQVRRVRDAKGAIEENVALDMRPNGEYVSYRDLPKVDLSDDCTRAEIIKDRLAKAKPQDREAQDKIRNVIYSLAASPVVTDQGLQVGPSVIPIDQAIRSAIVDSNTNLSNGARAVQGGAGSRNYLLAAVQGLRSSADRADQDWIEANYSLLRVASSLNPCGEDVKQSLEQAKAALEERKRAWSEYSRQLNQLPLQAAASAGQTEQYIEATRRRVDKLTNLRTQVNQQLASLHGNIAIGLEPEAIASFKKQLLRQRMDIGVSIDDANLALQGLRTVRSAQEAEAHDHSIPAHAASIETMLRTQYEYYSRVYGQAEERQLHQMSGCQTSAVPAPQQQPQP